MQVSTRALVISSVKYSEADLIVRCFTASFGLKSYLLRGILKSRRGKLRASLFQPLSLLQLEAIHKDKGSLERIKEAKIAYPYQSLHTEIIKSSLVLFIAEILKNTIREEEANPGLFDFLEKSLLWLDDHDAVANFHLVFLLKLSKQLGFYPDFGNRDFPYFNLLEGVFQKEPYGNHCESGDSIEAFKGLFGIEFVAIQQLKLNKTERREVLDLLLLYYQLHLQGFKNPKSVSVLNQLFN